MTLSFKEMGALLSVGDLPELDFSAITSDSRQVGEGALFVALKGERVDGHDFAAQARSNGAVAIMGERPNLAELEDLPYIHVPHARQALGILAHRLAGEPTKDMTVIGVTGTNGKSSTVYLIDRIFRTAGTRVAHFGTLGYGIGDEKLDAPHTTPFAEDLADMFRRAKQAGCTHAVMEVSSHALEQERVAGIAFSVGVFTNLTQDHLDYHKDMDGYLAEKLKLFERVEGDGAFNVANLDDPYGRHFIEASSVPCPTYGAAGDCRAENVRIEMRETSFIAHTPWGAAEIRMRLLGSHNVSNALAAITVAGALGIPLDTIAEGIASVDSVPGRFEHIDAGQEFQVIVDYAHTEDGLRNVLQAAREICEGRIICVFGCGGDRDTGKRPKMAAVSAELADYSIVTSDNPRTESPERILLDVEVGLQHAGKKRDDDYLVFIERGEAIQKALEMAEPGDLVMIAGKGHEDYQIIGEERIHFDDREVARSLLETMGA